MANDRPDARYFARLGPYGRLGEGSATPGTKVLVIRSALINLVNSVGVRRKQQESTMAFFAAPSCGVRPLVNGCDERVN